MRYILVIVILFGIKNVAILCDMLFENKKTFVFSGDLNLNSKFSKGNVQEVKNDVSRIIENKEKEKKGNIELKDAVNSTIEKIQKENKMEKLPDSGITEEEEMEAKDESTFLSDDLEEAAKNFSSVSEPSDSEDKEAEMKSIKKYQAEVMNAMSHSGPYQNIDSDEIEKIRRTEEEDSEDICLQDFSIPCPVLFFRTSLGCVPTKTYEGPCNKIQDKLPLLYDHQKESWSEICETSWPCMPKECPYGVDYNSICPVGWNDIGKGVCSSTYENENCPYDINFSNTTIEEKKKIAKECKLRWKCKSVSYLTNFDSTCPLNWTPIGDYKCKAPIDYTGDCPKISNLKKYNTQELKKQIEVTCLVNWPYTLKVNEYQRDYDSICPIGWSLTTNMKCKSPENYKSDSKCSDEVAFTNMTSIQKESHSFACKVDFPFKDRKDCKRDYSFKCPMGWVPSKKIGFCKAPLSFKSKICKNFSSFQNISDSHRQYYLKKCDIDWPCVGEIENSLIYTKIPVDYVTNTNIRRSSSGAVDAETGTIIF